MAEKFEPLGLGTDVDPPTKPRQRSINRNSVRFKLRDNIQPGEGALDGEAIERLGLKHSIDADEMVRLSILLKFAVTSPVRPSPEKMEKLAKAGASKVKTLLSRANVVRESLADLEFDVRLIRFEKALSSGEYSEDTYAVDHLKKAIHNIDVAIFVLGKYDELGLTPIDQNPNRGQLSDERLRQVLRCIFKVWGAQGRELSYSSSHEKSDLHEFVNDVMACITKPSRGVTFEFLKAEIIKARKQLGLKRRPQKKRV